MDDENVGGAIVGDDLAFDFVVEGGSEGKHAAHGKLLADASFHGVRLAVLRFDRRIPNKQTQPPRQSYSACSNG